MPDVPTLTHQDVLSPVVRWSPRWARCVEWLRRRPLLFRAAAIWFELGIAFRDFLRSVWFVARLAVFQRRAFWRALPRVLRYTDWRELPALVRENRAAFSALRPDLYRRWAAAYDTLSADDRNSIRERISQLRDRPVISVLVPVYDTPESWLRKALDSVLGQLYPHWELCLADDASTSPYVRPLLEEYARRDPRVKCAFREANGGIAEATNSALVLATGDFIALLDHDDELAEHALAMMALELERHPSANLVYSDEDKIDTHGNRSAPYFKTDWNPDLILSHNMVCHLGVYRTELVRAVGGFRAEFEGSQDYDLALRVAEQSSPEQLRHVPHVLYHWRLVAGSTAKGVRRKNYAYDAGRRAIAGHLERRGVEANVEQGLTPGSYRVAYPLPDPLPMVSVIIPTRDRAELLRRCVRGLLERTDYGPLEILIVDNGSREPDAVAYLASLADEPRVRVLPYDRPFNHSEMNNLAAREARGTVLCLLNNDVEPIDPGWLREMVSQACRPDVGVVGAQLYFPNDTTQHAGTLLGLSDAAGHAHSCLLRGLAAPFDRNLLIQNFSAVTAACCVIRKDVFDDVGGFDVEAFPITFNDVDLCLRIGERGYHVVYTPFATLYHYESASLREMPTRRVELRGAVDAFRQRYGDRLDALADRFHNPNLSRWHHDYRLAAPPRKQRPWSEERPA